ncbi:MAG: DUF305 domain-containing protein [Gemmatimonadaceae bacterium]|nr:DUF305 domain-containing protein [Gemmatimonadaceae bacterium]
MPRIPTLFVAAALGLAACSGRSGPSTPSPAELSGIERARLDSLRYPYTMADISFMSGMIHHHAQAIKISRWAPTHGASAELQRLAARIINAQNDEITLMRRWLGDRNQVAPSVDSTGSVTMPMAGAAAEHAGHDMSGGHAGDAAMPGMLSAEQLAELDAARGESFDLLFLQRMIAHHRGAVTMVRELQASRAGAQDETIFKFAADVEVDQTTEIRRMLTMLLERGGIPPQ